MYGLFLSSSLLRAIIGDNMYYRKKIVYVPVRKKRRYSGRRFRRRRY